MAEIIPITPRCSFCGATRDMVAYMVQSPYGPLICDTCVEYAHNCIVDAIDEKAKRKRQADEALAAMIGDGE